MRSLVYDENLCKIDGHKFAFFIFFFILGGLLKIVMIIKWD